jgi:hypothetical protein
LRDLGVDCLAIGAGDALAADGGRVLNPTSQPEAHIVAGDADSEVDEGGVEIGEGAFEAIYGPAQGVARSARVAPSGAPARWALSLTRAGRSGGWTDGPGACGVEILSDGFLFGSDFRLLAADVRGVSDVADAESLGADHA